jgi:osmotically inducible protein OsmC
MGQEDYMADRTAQATWKGTLTEGSGTINSVGSGAISDLGVTWKARTQSSDGMTSPEELIAAAHAACYAMAFSNVLAKAGHPADQLNVTAVCSFEPKPEGGWKISKMRLDVEGRVPGVDNAEFQRLAEEGEAGCPVSAALRNNVDIQLNAHLAA